MHLSKQDLVATVLVGVAGILYLMWATEYAAPGMNSVRVTGAVILALGFAASAVAVVPGFGRLLHGSKAYLAITAGIGLVASCAAVVMLFAASGGALAIVMAAMAVLWLIATVHHASLARSASSGSADVTLRRVDRQPSRQG